MDRLKQILEKFDLTFSSDLFRLLFEKYSSDFGEVSKVELFHNTGQTGPLNNRF